MRFVGTRAGFAVVSIAWAAIDRPRIDVIVSTCSRGATVPPQPTLSRLRRAIRRTDRPNGMLGMAVAVPPTTATGIKQLRRGL